MSELKLMNHLIDRMKEMSLTIAILLAGTTTTDDNETNFVIIILVLVSDILRV